MVVELVKRMEELLLRPLFTTQYLNIIDQKGISRSVVLMKQRHAVRADARDQLIHEPFSAGVDHAHPNLLLQQLLADGLNEVRFSDAHAAIDEQWVVGVRWLLNYGIGRGVRKLVAGADNEAFERVALVEWIGRWREEGIAAHGRTFRRLCQGVANTRDLEDHIAKRQFHLPDRRANVVDVFFFEPLLGFDVWYRYAEPFTAPVLERCFGEPALETFPR